MNVKKFVTDNYQSFNASTTMRVIYCNKNMQPSDMHFYNSYAPHIHSCRLIEIQIRRLNVEMELKVATLNTFCRIKKTSLILK